MAETGTFIVELEADGEELQLDRDSITFIYTESLYGCAVYSVNCRSDDWDRWGNVVKNNERMSFRIRWSVDKDDDHFFGAWRNIEFDLINLTYGADYVDLQADGACRGINLSRRCHLNTFVNMRISQMVETLAAQNNLEARVTPTKRLYSFYQCNMSDSDFIRYMMPYAIDETNVGGYRFYVDKGKTLVFEPPNIIGAESLGTFGVEGGQFGEDIIGSERLSVEYRRFFQAKEHHDCVLLRGFQTLDHEPATWLANESTVEYDKLARRSPQVQTVPSSVIVTNDPLIGLMRPADLKAKAVSIWSAKCQSLFRTTIKLLPMADAEIGKKVVIVAKNPNGDEHYASGDWIVYETQQVRRPKEEYTLLKVERRNWSG